MSDTMNFPNNWKDFINDYKFKDKEETYTNGADLISVLRVEQMIEHYFINNKPRAYDVDKVVKVGKWIPVSRTQPPKTGNCIATVEKSDGTAVLTYVVVEHYNHGDDWTGCYNGKKSYRKITAWMPLPEVYMESKEK